MGHNMRVMLNKVTRTHAIGESCLYSGTPRILSTIRRIAINFP